MLAGEAILATEELRMNAEPSSFVPGLKSRSETVECNVSSPVTSGARVSDWF
jgi:hypothetical protein